jgi:predicted ester cyclase
MGTYILSGSGSSRLAAACPSAAPWDLPPTGNRVELEFFDIFRVSDGKLIEHWTSMDLAVLRNPMRASSQR